ncbi:AI-2E family transporter [uncultured Actinomyces sp.]|uniref:AI-2E family transporter n=1 Tax=uncultured Actinomyces sp. TaxID=249061 RepID=UPI0028D16AB6|nr:AI-2E family transporter [uncultured Actinomyces sp.]
MSEKDAQQQASAPDQRPSRTDKGGGGASSSLASSLLKPLEQIRRRVQEQRSHLQGDRPQRVRVVVEDEPTSRDASEAVPWSLRVGAAVAWRAIVVIAAVALLIFGMTFVYGIIVPIAVALLLAVFLNPMVSWLHRKAHFPRALAALSGLLATVVVVGAALSTAGAQILSQVPSLLTRANEGLTTLLEWLRTSPLGIDTSGIDSHLENLQSEIVAWVQSHAQSLIFGAVNATSSAISIATGSVIALFCLFFFLKDGRDIWVWFVRLLPKGAREPVHEAAIRGWASMGGYVVGQMQVAFIDALSIGIGAYFLGVPLVIPIIVLVFFGSFIPIIGSLISGIIAVLVAVVDQGFTVGLIMLVIILLVQQVEGNLLQPLLMSNAVSLHPLVVLLGVTAGSMVAGIAGAIFSIPIAAFINSTVLYLHGHDPEPALATKLDRPGGAPGTLDALIAHSYGEDLPLLAGEAVDAHTYDVNEELSERMVTAGTAEPGDSVGTRVADEIEQSAETHEEDSEA